jgi:hypothetical protein
METINPQSHMTPSFRAFLAGALLFALPLSAAEIVYDNSVNDLAFNLDPGAQEIGDEIVLDGTARWLSEFSFEYWGDNTLSETEFAGPVEARIRFYLNDGPALPGVDDALTPGTVFFDSGTFAIDPTERATLTFTDFVTDVAVPLAVDLPDAFTWSVEFTGLGVTDTAGVTIYSPPAVGSSFDDYWVNTSGTWTLQTNVVAIDFAARFSAVPEPTALALAICGGMLALAVGWKKLKN